MNENSNKCSSYVDSYYSATAFAINSFESLEGDAEADVCIIGGGYTGISCALHLAEQGVSVILLEAEKVAWGASGRNGGHVGTGQRVGQRDLERVYGIDTAKKFWDLSLQATDLVRQLIARHQISCDIKQGILHVAAKANEVEYMQQSVTNLQNKYGYQQMRFVDKSEVDQMLGSNKYYAAQLDSGSMHLHPLNYALGLAKAATTAGALIYENSRVVNYHEKATDKSNTILVQTNKGKVRARKMLLACNGYLKNLEPKIAGKMMPINNFILATEPLSDNLAKSLIRDDVAVQDSLFVINYWKLSGDNRLIFGGGENYTKRFPADIKSFVRKYMLRIYPQLESAKIDYAWGGTLSITMKRMPHLGKLSNNIYYSHGYSGHGVPTATFCGKLVADAITDNPSQFNLMAELPSISFPGGTLLRWPGLVAGMLYHSMLDKL